MASDSPQMQPVPLKYQVRLPAPAHFLSIEGSTRRRDAIFWREKASQLQYVNVEVLLLLLDVVQQCPLMSPQV